MVKKECPFVKEESNPDRLIDFCRFQEVVPAVSEKYDKSVAQVILRFLIQKVNMIPIRINCLSAYRYRKIR